MKLFSIYTTLLALSFTYTVQAQVSDSEQEHRAYLIGKASLHINQFDYDSAIYYVHKRIEFDIKTKQESDLIVAYSSKIGILRLQNKYEEAYRIALTTFDNYCDVDSKDENCAACSYLYNELYTFSLLMKNYRQGLEYLEMQCNKESNWFSFYYKKADLYVRLNLPDSALITTAKGISIRENQKDGLRLVHAYNNHGLIATFINKLDTAIAAFEKAIHPDIYLERAAKLYPVIKGNIGECYYKKKNFEKAYEYLLLDAEESLKNNVLHSYVSASKMLAQIDIEQGDHIKGINRLESLLHNYDKYLNTNQELDLHEKLMKAYQALGNNSKYNFYLEKWITLNKLNFKNKVQSHQALTDESHANSLRNVHTNIENEKKLMNQEILILEKDKEKSRLENGLLISGLSMVTILVLFFFWRYRIIQRRNALIRQTELDSAQKEQEILELKVKEENRSVQELSLELITKKDFSETILERLREFEDVSKSDLLNMELFIQNELEIKSTRAELQNQMGELSSNFYNELKIHHPNLSEIEVKLASMIVMKMSNKEIAINKNITSASVRVAKVRLKKKLDPTKDIDLSAYLGSLL